MDFLISVVPSHKMGHRVGTAWLGLDTVTSTDELNRGNPMLYLVAILLPPLAVLLAGKPVQALLNILLTLFFWIPGMLHALFVVHGHYADQRTAAMIRAMEGKPAKPKSFRLS
jgi:uncharacterized membrane protein YqaE (UPF0057 family)